MSCNISQALFFILAFTVYMFTIWQSCAYFEHMCGSTASLNFPDKPKDDSIDYGFCLGFAKSLEKPLPHIPLFTVIQQPPPFYSNIGMEMQMVKQIPSIRNKSLYIKSGSRHVIIYISVKIGEGTSSH